MAKGAKLKPILLNNNGHLMPGQQGYKKSLKSGGHHHHRRIKRVSWNEDVDGATESGQQKHQVQEFNDPAILTVVGGGGGGGGGSNAPPTAPEFRYSKDELIKLRNAQLSTKRPDFLDAAYYNNNGIWDPEPWHYNNKQVDSPNENGGGGGGGRGNDAENHKRRPGDPRERIRKEQDGIVLSPQRRSFNSGCFVPVREPLRPNRAHSPLGPKAETPHIGGSGHRDLNAGPVGRRIGSGRILPWDFQEKSDVDNDFGYRRERRDTDRDERFERRTFSRDYEGKEKERHMGRNNNNNNNARYSNRRISNESREEEPEWFSSGPMSQNDTIELRGFDENEKLGNKKKTAAQKKKQLKEQQLTNNNKAKDVEEKKARSLTPVPQDGAGETSERQRSPAKERDGGGGGDGPHIGVPNEASFNFEDILKCESIPGLLSNGVESGDAAGSRFSRWFKREKSPPNKQDSRRSSLQDPDHHQIIKNLLGDPYNDQPSVTIPQPGDSESYFAPISPAASSVPTQQQQHHHHQKSQNLMEMLQRGGKHDVPLKGMETPGPGKILSLEELEARMIQGADMSGKQQTKGEDDLNAFKRLFSQSNSNMNHNVGNNGPMAQPQQKPMSIMEMLNHSQQQEEAARLANQQQRNMPPHMASDMSYKFHNQGLQQQQKFEMLGKMMNSTIARASPLQDMSINQSRELLNRPEAQAILQGLKRGDITPQHLYQQLANPAMQPRHRDLLLTILKMQVAGGAAGGMTQSASPVSANPPHPIYQQQLRVSPLPPNAYCVSPIMATSPNTLSVPALHQRIPSPRELQVHTQNIMQRALIKKKLEEQEENFRKKQQQHRGTSPAKTASPTPLAFTPTAVLRKMTADKEDGLKEAKGEGKLPQGRALTGMRAPISTANNPQVASQQAQNWNAQFQQLKQPGRPIVKANNNYQQPNQVNQQQQEQYYQQQRLLQQQLQQRKNQQTFGTSYSGQNQQQQQQQYPQLSQQQMRAQHQNVRAQHQQQQGFPQHQQQPQTQQPPQSWAHQMLQGQGFDNRQQVGRGGGMDGDLSPTSNQLARWFSPELLDRARKGKLPGIPPTAVPQNALSLEEVERQNTPVIGHN